MTDVRSKPTIKDIARISRSSPSTVSAVLSGSWRARRISEETADKIRRIAGAEGYSANMQARGLRSGRSGMVGLILPVHDNRFFAAMSQSFEAEARTRGWCPVVVSTLRDPAEEIRTVETLISYAIDSLVIAGATDPAAVGDLCRAAGVRHVYLDLPGTDAPSVVTDNHAGAADLTRAILAGMQRDIGGARGRPYLVGGVPGDHASARRIGAFREVVAAECGSVEDDQVIACGYAPLRARQETEALYRRLGGLPAALFINSLTVFEGVLDVFRTLPPEAFERTVIGVYDYDPFATLLQFPVHMVRQNSAAMVARALELIEADVREPILVTIEPELIAPRAVSTGPLSDLG